MTDRAVPLSSLGLTARAGANPMITGIAVDSREVREGTLFAAMPGSRVHGAEFIQYALRMGAAAVLTDAAGAKLAAEELAGSDAALVVSDSPREALARTAALWFGGQPATMIAVTGTNGKTSVSTFVRQIWVEMGLPAVNLGTTGVEGAWAAPLAHTTPEPITLHRTLAEAAQNGITHAAMEASSHGLDQRRLDGVTLKAAGFTNFTQDHLDYHETFEAYFAAKAALFARVLSEDGTAVVNIDDEKGVDIAAIARARGCEVITVGRDGGDLHLQGQRFDATGQDLRFTWRGKTYQKRLNLIGGFQGDNVLLAAGLVIACGADAQEVFDTLPHLTTVRGRMQLAATRDNGAAVFVDYAHTPDALAAALGALRPEASGKLVVLFGCGGDRDPGKRAMMGKVACEIADDVIITDDNPRSEDPASIRSAILESCDKATEIVPRDRAIATSLGNLVTGDVLLIAGKGHETGQLIGTETLPFDDASVANNKIRTMREALQ